MTIFYLINSFPDLEHNWCDKPREGLASSKGVIKACSGDIVLLAACEDGKLANEWSEHSPGVKGMFTRVSKLSLVWYIQFGNPSNAVVSKQEVVRFLGKLITCLAFVGNTTLIINRLL